MSIVQDYVSNNFSLLITAIFFFLSFLSFIGAMIWLSLLGKNYIQQAEELPQNEQ